MVDLDIFIGFKNNRGEISCKEKILEPDLKILLFCTELSLYNGRIPLEHIENP